MREGNIQREAMIAASQAGARLFRNNVAQGWVAQPKDTRVIREPDGTMTVILRNARVLHAGLGVGSSDTIGYSPLTVTELDIGRTIAVFTAVEFKTPEGRATSEQTAFIKAVHAAGGRAGVARSIEDCLAVVSGPFPL